MSRKTVPILLASIGTLFIALVVIIVLMLATDERKTAGSQRRTAVQNLLSKDSGDSTGMNENNLAAVAAFVGSPVAGGGSLNNLLHYMGKDPGRKDFPRSGDRKRAEKYLAGNSGDFTRDLGGQDVPSWVPSYVDSVSWLFETVKTDIFRITGYPEELTYLENSGAHSLSATEMTTGAISVFAEKWIPSGQTNSSYEPDRALIRAWLTGNRRFNNRVTGIDEAWKNLTATLYNLSVDSRWQTAVNYAPSLEGELNELIIMVLSADIYRRDLDMMTGVPDSQMELGGVPGPGILWLPEFSYYKNIPEITGYTADEDPVVYFAKVSLVYTFRDGRTQTWLNRRKDWMSDYFQSYFSHTVSSDFSPLDEVDMEQTEWLSSRLKASAIHGINRKIVAAMPFGTKKVYGLRDLALVRMNLLSTL